MKMVLVAAAIISGLIFTATAEGCGLRPMVSMGIHYGYDLCR